MHAFSSPATTHRTPTPSAAVLDALEREAARTDAVRAQTRAAAVHTAVPTRAFVRATAAWLGASFALCYLAIPLMLEGAGLRAAHLAHLLPGELLGMALASGWLLTRVLRRSDRGDIALDLPQLAESDRIPAAALGGLLAWGLLHNVLPGLLPMGRMPVAFLLSFGLANVLENVLFGTVIGTVARSRREAFTMGALFQLVLLGAAWIL